MPLLTNSNINSNFIKYKGKIYKKTNNQVVADLSNLIDKVEDTYETEEQAIYGAGKKNEEEGFKVRPVFSKIDTSTFVDAVTSSKNNTYDIRVINKDSSNRWLGQGSSNCFSISGFQNMELNLLKSKSYTFNQFDFTNFNNRLILTTDPEGLNQVTFPIQSYTGVPGVNGILRFTIPIDADKTYYLSSSQNRFMGIKINVDSYVETMPSDITFFDLLSSSYYVPLSTII